MSADLLDRQYAIKRTLHEDVQKDAEKEKVVVYWIALFADFCSANLSYSLWEMEFKTGTDLSKKLG